MECGRTSGRINFLIYERMPFLGMWREMTVKIIALAVGQKIKAWIDQRCVTSSDLFV